MCELFVSSNLKAIKYFNSSDLIEIFFEINENYIKKLFFNTPFEGQGLKDVKSIVLKNPCSFPVEVYSVEMDKQYLMEETVHDLCIYTSFASV